MKQVHYCFSLHEDNCFYIVDQSDEERVIPLSALFQLVYDEVILRCFVPADSSFLSWMVVVIFFIVFVCTFITTL